MKQPMNRRSLADYWTDLLQDVRYTSRTLRGMAIALVFVALASGYVPARRASGINPMEALRNN